MTDGTRRVPLLPTMLLVSIVSAVAGWSVASRVESPADSIQGAQPPLPSEITVPVERQVVVSEVITRGTVRFDGLLLVPTPSTDALLPVVTLVTLQTGDELNEGSVVAEIAGRPMIAIDGQLPPYRDLTVGDLGPDVLQLELALDRLGLLATTPDDSFDDATSQALSALYQDLGYLPPTLGDDGLAARREAMERVRLATEAVAQAERTARGAALPGSTILLMDAAIASAQLNLSQQMEDRDREVEALVIDRRAADVEVDSARDALEVAEGRLAAAQNGAHPDTGEPATAEELDVLSTAVEDARTRVEVAQAAADAAIELLRQAETRWEQLVTIAETEVQIAEAQKAEAIASQTAPEVTVPLDQARAELDAAEEALQLVLDTTGTSMRASEFLVVPDLPRSVLASDLSVGDVPEDTLLTLTGGSLLVTADVAAADLGAVSLGQAVEVDLDAGSVAEGRVVEVASEPSTGGATLERYEVIVELHDELPPQLEGRNFRVRIPLAASDGPLLVVPLAALSTSASGQTQLDVIRASGDRHVVEVEVGIVASGIAGLTFTSAPLDTTDRVVVGQGTP